MPPKAKPGAKGKAAPAGKAAAKAAAEPAPPEEASPALSVADAEANLAEVTDEQWAELADCDTPPEPVARVLEALLVLLGEVEAGQWPVAQAALAERPALLRELRALGPWGNSDEEQLQRAADTLKAADIEQLRPRGAAGSGAAAVAALKGGAKAKPAAKPGAKAKAAPAPAALPPGAEAAFALAMLVEAILAAGREDKPPGFPMSWPTDPFMQLHARLQQARLCKQSACIICSSAAAVTLAMLYFERRGSTLYNLPRLQVRMSLAKSLSQADASAELAKKFSEAMKIGQQLILVLGDAVPDIKAFCGQGPNGCPLEALDLQKAEDAAKSLGLSGPPKAGFHVVVLVELSKARAEKQLPELVPGFDEMAVLVVDEKSLPSPAAIGEEPPQPSLRAALRLLALPAAEGPKATVAKSTQEDDERPSVNAEDFEFLESFGEDYEQRWLKGPSSQDEKGKPIRDGLLSRKLIKYPSNPKDAKPCVQLMGGANNSPCTGIWTSFTPLARPTEVEFEFTINGKVEHPNACVVFTEREFTGALPDCKVGIQFIVRGGMQLCGGAGNLVKISNDGKIQNDKWNKVLLKIDWDQKLVVGQVDTKGKGYAPAIQTVPFRDDKCQGFGYVYIYNTDTQATCWFHSLRIKQEGDASMGDMVGLAARKELADRLKQREYQRAVDADMEVGMVMGAISCTKQHNMNLAQEQLANAGAPR